jgi:hypothetical protein
VQHNKNSTKNLRGKLNRKAGFYDSDSITVQHWKTLKTIICREESAAYLEVGQSANLIRLPFFRTFT